MIVQIEPPTFDHPLRLTIRFASTTFHYKLQHGHLQDLFLPDHHCWDVIEECGEFLGPREGIKISPHEYTYKSLAVPAHQSLQMSAR